jgi:peroxiredoxin
MTFATRPCRLRLSLTIAAAFCLSLAAAPAGDADTDWKGVVALDAGPQERPPTEEGARKMIHAHLLLQEKALRTFLAGYPADARAFEARLRLARALQIRGDFENSEKVRAEGRRLLDELEKKATPAQRVELDFSKVTCLMRNLREVTPARREEVRAAARKFQEAHPTDRRLAALLAEVATLFDGQPKVKEALLEDAQPLAQDAELKARIADDLKRVRLLGEEVPLSFTSVQGREVRLAELRGRPVLVVFFAGASRPSVGAIASVQATLAELPPGSVHVLAVSLDDKREALDAVIKARSLTWPVAFDGKSWESPLVRALGINAVPTVWLLDARGRLRSLNALDGTTGQVRQLQRER